MTEEDKKNILHVVKDCSDSLTRIEGEREFIKEAIVGLNDKYELDKKHLRKVISIYYKQNKSEVEAEQGEVIELYESLTK
jgi:hypothetical protein